MDNIVSFPKIAPAKIRHCAPGFLVGILPDPDGWLVVARQHSWFFTKKSDAIREASQIALGFNTGMLIHLGGRS